jgi:predicted kinase
MPRLVHLNGPAGIGKSTLAGRYIDDHPLAFCLDIDGFRRLIGRWDEHEGQSGLLARAMAIKMATTHLSAGYDVVVPQYVARPAFVRELAGAATRAGASFHEIVLLDDPEPAEARFDQRAEDPARAIHHQEAVRAIKRSGGFRSMYDRLMLVVADLPAATPLWTTADDVAGSYRELLAALERDGQQMSIGHRSYPAWCNPLASLVTLQRHLRV